MNLQSKFDNSFTFYSYYSVKLCKAGMDYEQTDKYTDRCTCTTEKQDIL